LIIVNNFEIIRKAMSDTSSMPNPLSPDSTKNSADFGLKTIKSCYNQWRNGYGAESWAVRQKRFDYNRSYATGKYDMQEFKDILNVDGQMAFINLDYSSIPIAIPILNRIKDRYNQRIEKVVCNSIDPFTQNKKKIAKDNALFKLKNKEKILALQEQAGVQLEEFSDSDPEDEQEIDIEFGYNYKVSEEITMQNLIDIVFYDNKFTQVEKDMIFNEIFNCGYTITYTHIDANGRIKTPLIKTDNFFSSYSEWNDFRDWQWQGHIDMPCISEIRLKYPGKISEEELYNLAKSNAGKNGNGAWNDRWNYSNGESLASPYDGFTVQVCHLTYKTLYNLKYEKNRDRFGKEVLDKAKEVKAGKEYETSKPYYVSYTGCWIVDTEHLLEWGLSKNMIKPEKNLTEIYSPYSVYMHDNMKMTNTPLVETMIPTIKSLTLIGLQTQKLIASIAPDGSNIDVTGLSDIDMGAGVGVVSPMQLYKIYLQTGDKYFKGFEDSGDGQRQAPITQSSVPFSNKLEQLEAKWQAEYQKLTIYTGGNSLANGEIRNQAVGKTVLQDAKQIGESASNYTYNTFLNIFTETARKAQILGWDILVYGKKGYDGYRMALGTEKIEYLKVEATDDFEKTQFDVKIEAVIDDTEQQRLQEKINICLGQKEITLQDALDVEQLAKSNIKYASQLLASRLRKREKQLMKQKEADIQANNEAAQIAGETANKGAIVLEILKSKLQARAREGELESMKQQEIIKFTSIAKIEVLKATVAKEGGTIEQVPEWVLDGIPLVNAVQTALMEENIQSMEEVAMSEGEQLAFLQEQAFLEAEQEMQQQQEV
jgi:hypothetical protein